MRLKVIKNNAIETEIYNVETDFVNQTTVIPLPATQVAIEPGDTLTLTVDGTGFLGNGTSTFSAWNLNIQEIDPEIDADFSENYSVGEEDLPIWEAGFGTTLGATQQDGDADGNTGSSRRGRAQRRAARRGAVRRAAVPPAAALSATASAATATA